MKLFFFSFAFSFLTLTNLAMAGTINCDRYGYCTGETSDGQAIATFTNSSGVTTGYIGSNKVDLYHGGNGNIIGHVGDRRIDVDVSQAGSIYGTDGAQNIEFKFEGDGLVKGEIGDTPFNAYYGKNGEITTY